MNDLIRGWIVSHAENYVRDTIALHVDVSASQRSENTYYVTLRFPPVTKGIGYLGTFILRYQPLSHYPYRHFLFDLENNLARQINSYAQSALEEILA